MRLLNRFHLAALLFPLLLLALTPELQRAARNLVFEWQGAGLDSGFIPTQLYQVAPQDILNGGPVSLDGQIWAVARGDFGSQLKRFERDKTGQWRNGAKMLAFAELSQKHPRNALILVQALVNSAGADGRVAGPWEDNWNAPSALRSSAFSGIAFNSFTPGELAWACNWRGAAKKRLGV